MRRFEEPEQGLFAISSPRTDSITKHGRLGKLHGVPALAGSDRLKAGLSYEGSVVALETKKASLLQCCSEFLRVEEGGVCVEEGGCRSAATAYPNPLIEWECASANPKSGRGLPQSKTLREW
jgi:hypothetical protein